MGLRSGGIAFVAAIAFAAAHAAGATAGRHECSRVLPGPGFPRPITGTLQPPAVPRARAGRGPSGFDVIATYEMDLTGQGAKVPIVVEGIVLQLFETLYFPRVVDRVDDFSTMNVLWSQELPGGLFGQGVVEDVDRDGRDDLRFSSFRRQGLFFTPAAFQLFWGDGDHPLTVGQRTHSALDALRFEDVDGDGMPDAVVAGTDGTSPEVYTTYFPGISPREFDEGIRYTPIAEGVTIDEPGRRLAVGDLNEDGLDDVLATTQFEFTHTLGFARGDGTFDLRPLPLPDGMGVNGRIDDLDGDGHLDLVLAPVDPSPSIYVAWGHGDGTFDPYAALSLGESYAGFELGDVDGDGRDDIVAVFRASPDPANVTRGASFPMRGRSIGSPVPFEVASSRLPVFRLADLDHDGLADLVFSYARSGERPRLAWRKSTGQGRFGASLDLLYEPLTASVEDIVPTDFDLDGIADLFVTLADSREGHDASLSLRGDGLGGFEVVFRGPRIVPSHSDRLIDVDADGRPDLVSWREVEELDGDTDYPVTIRPGDGLGGFLPPLEGRSMSFAGEPGRFRTGGTRDLARIGTFGDRTSGNEIFGQGVFQLEVNPSTGYVLDRDGAPPIVELRVLPVPGSTDPDLRRLATLPVDDCSSAPRVTERLVDLLPLGVGYPLTFERSATDEVLVFEVPETGRRGVVLRGPSRPAAIEAFLAARGKGGYPFRHMQPMRLSVADAYGDPLPGFPGARLVERIALDGGFVTGASATRPGADITFTLTATDGVRPGVTHASLVGSEPARAGFSARLRPGSSRRPAGPSSARPR